MGGERCQNGEGMSRSLGTRGALSSAVQTRAWARAEAPPTSSFVNSIFRPPAIAPLRSPPTRTVHHNPSISTYLTGARALERTGLRGPHRAARAYPFDDVAIAGARAAHWQRADSAFTQIFNFWILLEFCVDGGALGGVGMLRGLERHGA